MKFTDLNHSEYNPYYSNYISLVSLSSILHYGGSLMSKVVRHNVELWEAEALSSKRATELT